MQDIVSMIVNVGYPIVSSLCLGYYIKKLHDDYRSDYKELQVKHEKEVDDLTQAINDLTCELRMWQALDVEK